jgi:methionyl-tRNA formyltransferase
VYTEGKKTINEPVYVNAIQEIKPDVIVVCGTSILRDKIISIPPKGVLNLHGGLAQKYRGTCTTLWALFNGEPEYIGATVHYVAPGIDDGDILYQGRPEISITDDPETLYVKVVKLGIEMMIRAIEDIENERVRSCVLTEKGTLYLNRMITPKVLQRVWQNIDAGMLDDYLKNRAVRDEKVHSIMQNVFRT